jgi:hypothetical protein
LGRRIDRHREAVGIDNRDGEGKDIEGRLQKSLTAVEDESRDRRLQLAVGR